MASSIYTVGLDVGQVNDPTAAALVERHPAEVPIPDSGPPGACPHCRHRGWRREGEDWRCVACAEAYRPRTELSPTLRVSLLKRFPLRVPYPAMAAEAAELVREVQRRAPHSTRQLALDAGGVGRPMLDLIRRERPPCAILPVVITGGTVEGRQPDGTYSVPKRDLIGGLQVALQQRHLEIPRAIPEAEVLRQELADYRVKIDATTAHDSYDARSGAHDDLLLALALAVWAALRPVRSVPLPPPFVAVPRTTPAPTRGWLRTSGSRER